MLNDPTKIEQPHTAERSDQSCLGNRRALFAGSLLLSLLTSFKKPEELIIPETSNESINVEGRVGSTLSAKEIELRLCALDGAPDRQIELLHQAREIGIKLEDSVFASLATDKVQLEAIDLLALDSVGWMTKSANRTEIPMQILRVWLLENSKSDEVRAAIIAKQIQLDLVPRLSQVIPPSPALPECLIFSQFHRAPDMESADLRLVGEYQAVILRSLFELKDRSAPKGGFSLILEDLMEDISAGDPERREKFERYLEVMGEPRETLDQVLPLFAGYRVGDTLTPQQLECLGRVGAGIVYAVLFTETPTFAAIDRESYEQKVSAALNAVSGNGSIDQSFATFESDLLKRVGACFETGGRATVAVLYGIGHRFSAADFLGEPPSFSLTTVAWPELANKVIWDWQLGRQAEVEYFKDHPDLARALKERPTTP